MLCFDNLVIHFDFGNKLYFVFVLLHKLLDKCRFTRSYGAYYPYVDIAARSCGNIGIYTAHQFQPLPLYKRHKEHSALSARGHIHIVFLLDSGGRGGIFFCYIENIRFIINAAKLDSTARKPALWLVGINAYRCDKLKGCTLADMPRNGNACGKLDCVIIRKAVGGAFHRCRHIKPALV